MFTHKSLVYLFLIFFLPLLFSCSNSTSPESLDENEVIPLTMGNSWSYNYTYLDDNGNQTNSGKMESTIDKDTTVSDITYYRYSNHHLVWYTNKDDGYRAFNSIPDKETEILMYKYPVSKGDIYGTSEYSVEVISVNEKITVPFGTFNVIHYSTTKLNSNSIMNNYEVKSLETFVAPGIGLVKRIFIAIDSNGGEFVVNSEELESCRLK